MRERLFSKKNKTEKENAKPETDAEFISGFKFPVMWSGEDRPVYFFTKDGKRHLVNCGIERIKKQMKG